MSSNQYIQSPPPGLTSAENVGAGAGTLIETVTPDGQVQVKSLVAGSNITLTNNTTSVSIASTGGASSPLTTKGDLWGFSSADARIPIGTDTYVLTADSAQTLGLKWAASAASGANASLSNLSSVAFNAHLLPGVTGTYDIGAVTGPAPRDIFATDWVGAGVGKWADNNDSYLGFSYNSSSTGLPSILGRVHSGNGNTIEMLTGGWKMTNSGNTVATFTSSEVDLSGLTHQFNGSYYRLFTHIEIYPAGNTLWVSGGTNSCIGDGTDALTSGSKVVSTTAVKSTSQILITPTSAPSGTLYEDLASRVAGTSFKVKSTSGSDTCTFTWWIVEKI